MNPTGKKDDPETGSVREMDLLRIGIWKATDEVQKPLFYDHKCVSDWIEGLVFITIFQSVP